MAWSGVEWTVLRHMDRAPELKPLIGEDGPVAERGRPAYVIWTVGAATLQLCSADLVTFTCKICFSIHTGTSPRSRRRTYSFFGQTSISGLLSG